MKKYFLLLAVLLITSCQKELTTPWTPAAGLWYFESFQDMTGVKHTKAEPDWADDMFYVGDKWATINQGNRLAVPWKAQTITFRWDWLQDGRADMGQDTVNTYVDEHTLKLTRDSIGSPQFLEYIWFR